MRKRRFEVIPLRDDPEDYTWCSPELADYFTVYERDDEDLAHAIADLASLDEALVFAMVRTEQPAALWTGRMFIEARVNGPTALLRA